MPVADLSISDLPFVPVLYGTGIATAVIILLCAVLAIATARRANTTVRRHWLASVFYLAFLVVSAVLAGTSFTTILLYDQMSGYALLTHVAAAGAFVFLLLLVAVFWLPWGSTENSDRWWLSRLSAWGMVICGILTASTMFLSMLPILDTEGLIEMAALHRFAGLGVIATALLHSFTLICTRLGWR